MGVHQSEAQSFAQWLADWPDHPETTDRRTPSLVALESGYAADAARGHNGVCGADDSCACHRALRFRHHHLDSGEQVPIEFEEWDQCRRFLGPFVPRPQSQFVRKARVASETESFLRRHWAALQL